MRSVVPLLALLCCCAPANDDGPWTEGPHVERGGAIAAETFKALSGRLSEAMAAGGPAHAVDYCSLKALSIVDSLAVHHGVRIKRTSDRVRAPHDAPDTHEAQRLRESLERIAQGTPAAELEAWAFTLGDSIAFYTPILIASPMCLLCHGTPENGLDSAAAATIRERYPHDMAMGYTMGEFRGLWSIRWPR
jgi:hypothetical protein